MSTIFSKIIALEIPADIIYEDEVVIAFLDIKPVNKGHTLVIPKIPSTDGLECDEKTMAHVINVGQKIARVLKTALPCDGINFIMNNGAAAGQEVFHTHLHVVPRYENDNSFAHAKHVSYENDESKKLAVTLATRLI